MGRAAGLLPRASRALSTRPNTPGRLARLRALLRLRQPDLTVLVEKVQLPSNLGSVLRTAEAVGAATVHYVPAAYRAQHVDKHLDRLNKAARGSEQWLTLHEHADTPAAFRAVRSALPGVQILAADVTDRCEDFRAIDYTRPSCILVGAESVGLSDFSRREADRVVKVPIAGLVESLNVSVATAVILYEAQRQRQSAGRYAGNAFSEEQLHSNIVRMLHPVVFRFCVEHGLRLPRLDSEGIIDDDDFLKSKREIDARALARLASPPRSSPDPLGGS
jgi:tRNA (guanosine-2'-O-)-methyltransferase